MAFQRVCTATTKSGRPCRGAAWPGSATCLFHSQDRNARQALRRGRHLGGAAARARANRVLPNAPDVLLESASDVRALLAETCSQLRRGQLDRHAATGVGYLCGIALQSLEMEGEGAARSVEFVFHNPGAEDEATGEHGITYDEPTESPTEAPAPSNGHPSD